MLFFYAQSVRTLTLRRLWRKVDRGVYNGVCTDLVLLLVCGIDESGAVLITSLVQC